MGVAVYCNEHYEQILHSLIGVADSDDEREWLRRSFLKVDDEIRTPAG